MGAGALARELGCGDDECMLRDAELLQEAAAAPEPCNSEPPLDSLRPPRVDREANFEDVAPDNVPPLNATRPWLEDGCNERGRTPRDGLLHPSEPISPRVAVESRASGVRDRKQPSSAGESRCHALEDSAAEPGDTARSGVAPAKDPGLELNVVLDVSNGLGEGSRGDDVERDHQSLDELDGVCSTGDVCMCFNSSLRWLTLPVTKGAGELDRDVRINTPTRGVPEDVDKRG